MAATNCDQTSEAWCGCEWRLTDHLAPEARGLTCVKQHSSRQTWQEGIPYLLSPEDSCVGGLRGNGGGGVNDLRPAVVDRLGLVISGPSHSLPEDRGAGSKAAATAEG
ncbi:hypothetical protein NDU88_007498 [Pleurodeles waltl]|uniref:Uncharacterized protein n=1 Tax=Pleurodeles waltl TaxID=8319 RepID=A0AAV7QS38_PLEWA|nr:hypothetical protein NDU88_007498 [Pleurodeles waltl]